MASQGHDELRVDGLDLPLEIGQAVDDLLGSRIAVLRRSALQDVADEDLLALQAAGGDDLVEKLPRPADERPALGVFIRPRGLADEHDPGPRIALAGHGIRPHRPQLALAALPRPRRRPPPAPGPPPRPIANRGLRPRIGVRSKMADWNPGAPLRTTQLRPENRPWARSPHAQPFCLVRQNP